MIQTKNALIKSAEIKIERGFALVVELMLEYEHCIQGFGGWMLYNTTNGGHDVTGAYLTGLLGMAELENFADLRGKIVRIKIGEDGKIFSIGNAIKEKWFTPEVLFKKIKEEE